MKKTVNTKIGIMAIIAIQSLIHAQTTPYRYAIVVSNATLAASGWSEVVDSLITRHNAVLFPYVSNIWETQAQVSAFSPDYIGFVCQMSETPPSFVENNFWPYMRQLDADPYPDAVGGIITGCDATDALGIVTGPLHLDIKTVLGGTIGCDVNYFPQGIETDEWTYGAYRIKHPDSIAPVPYTDGPTDRTAWLVGMINGDSLIFGDSVDIFVTSGHGGFDIWQMHYPDPGLEGFFRSDGIGHLYGDQYYGLDIDIASAHPKIYFALGNCDVGQIWNAGCMGPAWIHSGGAYLVTAYVVPEGAPSYQHGATKTYFCRQDHYSWPTAFMLANCCFVFDLANDTPGIDDPWDLNGSALYGDPALDARVPDGPEYIYDTLLYTKELIVRPGQDRDTVTFRITMNKNGKPGYDWKWGSRSPIVLFPFRIDPDSIEILDTNADTAVIMENFALMYVWYDGQPELPAGTQRWVTFTARTTTGATEEESALSYPAHAMLHANYPNPFTTETTIKYFLNKRTKINLSVYDQSGRLVCTLIDAYIDAGYNEIKWLGQDASGRDLSSGIYFLRLKSETGAQTNKLLLLR